MRSASPLNIVIPMAGRGSRFARAGFKKPKPLIPILGKKTMIELVIENLRPDRPHRFYFLCLKEHLQSHEVEGLLKKTSPSSKILEVPALTQGAACTVLLARDFITNDQPLMIANSDQWIDHDINLYLEQFDEGGADGFIMTMKASDPKWSYLKFDPKREVIGVVEKEVVSDEATVGIYNFRRGIDFVCGADSMIRQDLRVNNEFYVAPVYNQLINQGRQIGYWNIGSEGNGMYGLGLPEDLAGFERLPIAWRAVK